MAWQYVEYKYPIDYQFDKILVWLSDATSVYFAVKSKETDDWVYYSGTAGHVLDTGSLLTSQGSSEANAQTDYLTATPDVNDKITCVFPSPIFAKYVRLYITDDISCTIHEFRPSTRLLADEIITGVLTISDDFASPPLIRVNKSDVDRILIGNFTGSTYGIVGYDGSSNKLFELSDATQEISGWTIGEVALSKNNTTISSTGVITLGTTDDIVQLSSIDGTYRIWVGNATAASAPFSVSKVGAIKAESGTVGGWTLATNKISLTGIELDQANSRIRVYTGSNYVDLTAGGLTGYDSVLGTVFRLYTDGTAPMFANGVIHETEYQIYTSGIIKTADDPASFGGLLIDSSSLTGYNTSGNIRFQTIYSGVNEGDVLIGNYAGNAGLFWDQSEGVFHVKGYLTITGGINALSEITTNLGDIYSGTITGAVIRTASSGRRIEITSSGIALQDGTLGTAYGVAEYEVNSYGSGILAWINNSTYAVPFYIDGTTVKADFHFTNRGSNPSGDAEIGDVAVVNGKLVICTTAPSTWTVVGDQTA